MIKNLLDKKWCLIEPATLANANVPNVGLAYISSTFDKLGVKHKVIDNALRPFKKDRFLDGIYDVYGISVKCNTLAESVRITDLLLKTKKDITIVWGGSHIRGTNIPDLQEMYPQVNLFYEGYLDLDLMKVTSKDISLIPLPSYEKFDSFNYFEDQLRVGMFAYPMMTSRGCSSRCTFCHSDKIFRYRSAKNCIEELLIAKERFKYKKFFVLDDNFIIRKERALEFCSLVKDQLKLPWGCPGGIRADQLDEKLALAMKESGCQHVSFGVESSDPNVLKIVKKGETIEQIEKAIEITKGVGIAVVGYFIIGLPGSTYESDLASWEWSKKMGITAHCSILIAIPGTELYHQNRDCVINENVSKALFFDDDNKDLIVAYETPEYPAEQRREVYKRIAKESGRW